MSKLIKSKSVILEGDVYKLSQDVFVSKEEYLSSALPVQKDKVSFSDIEDNILTSNDSNMKYADEIVEKAEQAAIDILDKAQDKADNLVLEARNSANEIEAEALKNANDVYENAKKRGYSDGYSSGFDEGKLESDRLIEEALNIKEELILKNKDFMLDKEIEMLELVVAISKKILKYEMENTDYMEGLISQAMESMSYARDIIIRVSAGDFGMANLIKPRILAMAERIESLEITVDHSLEQGAVIIDTPSGSIDASVYTQLDMIREALLNELSS